jgi:hypothetical protein
MRMQPAHLVLAGCASARNPQRNNNVRTSTLSLLGAVAIALAACGGGSDTPTLTMAVFGDSPYGTSPTDTSETQAFPGFVAQVNADPDVSLVLHAGDIHSGKQYCTQAYNQQIFGMYNTFADPLVYTPGDNEWADCHKAGEGGGTYDATTGTIKYVTDASGNPVDYASGNPADNLALVRSIFFAQPGKTMGGAMDVHTQAREFDPAFPNDAQYVENTWFIKNGVLVVATNIPGGSNNGTDPWYGAPSMSAQQQTEVANRTAAAQRWLKAAFNQAKSNGGVAAMLVLVQADMWDLDGKTTNAHISNYKPYIDIIAAGAGAFGQPVLLVNGDSHTYRSDNPLAKGSPCLVEPSSGAAATACTFDSYDNQPNGYNVPNFHRVVVHGSTTPLEWLKLTVDPRASADRRGDQAFGPFSWQRMEVK